MGKVKALWNLITHKKNEISSEDQIMKDKAKEKC